jgi:hypothetical protein
MRRRRLGALIAIVLPSAACGGGDPGAIDAPSSTSTTISASSAVAPTINPTTTPAVVSTTTPSTGGDWLRHELTIDTTGLETQSGSPELPRLTLIDGAGDRLVAIGSYGGGVTVWTSTDLEVLRPVYSEVCCERIVSAWAHFAVFGDRWLLGGTEQRPTETGFESQSFVWWSDDQGVTWTAADDAVFSEQANRIDGFTVAGDVVIAHAVNDRAGLVQMPVWTDDFVEWTPVTIAADRPVESVQFFADGSSVWAIGSALREDGGYDRIWSQSADGGRTFGSSLPLTSDRFALERVGETLVGLPYVDQHEYVDEPAVGLELIAADGTVTSEPVDTGQWGDGALRASEWTVDPASGRRYAIVGRQRQANVLYCYSDPTGCWQPEAAIATTLDGIEWFDVVAPPISMQFSADLDLLSIDGHLLITTLTDEQHVTVDEWTGPGLPPFVDPPSYPPPDRSVPLYECCTPQIAIGETYRYPLGIGGCGGLFVGEQRWEPEQPLPDPMPTQWPKREVEMADGPQAYLFGTITLVADDTIEFGIEGVGTVATFHPRQDESDIICG